MLTPELMDKLVAVSQDKSCFTDLHPIFVKLYSGSRPFQKLVAEIGAQAVAGAVTGDRFDAIGTIIYAIEFGYKLRTTEELEELARL